MTGTGKPLDESGAANNGEPETHDVRGVVIERGGIGAEQHRARDDRDRHLRDDMKNEPAVLGVPSRARRANGLHHRDDDDRT